MQHEDTSDLPVYYLNMRERNIFNMYLTPASFIPFLLHSKPYVKMSVVNKVLTHL